MYSSSSTSSGNITAAAAAAVSIFHGLIIEKYAMGIQHYTSELSLLQMF